MEILSFDQKKLLATFKRFFGDGYNTQSKEDRNTCMHIKAQKMCYLLKVAGVEIGDFSYSWNFRGPFSPGLLALLRSIDRTNVDVISSFYEQEEDQNKFLSGNEKKIDDLRIKLEIDKHREDTIEWIELLSSLTYISRSIFPGTDFNIVNQRLIQERLDYYNEAINYHAWNILNRMNLLTTTSL